MADLGGFGKGLLRKAHSAAESAEVALRKRIGDEEKDGPPPKPEESQSVAPPPVVEDGVELTPVGESDEPDERADAAEVADETNRLRQVIEGLLPPPGPITEPWGIGVGTLLAEQPRVPKRLRGIVRKLDRYGGVALSPKGIVYDGDDVEWEDITEIRTRNVVDYMLADGLQQQVESLPLPWFPGRRKALDALSQALNALTLAVLKDAVATSAFSLRIPAEIEYKGAFRRTKELSASAVGAMIMAEPQVAACILETARARGIAVKDDDESMLTAEQRAEDIRRKLAEVEKHLEKVQNMGWRKKKD
ncbi:hypothetical protein EV193_11155 [Herbihabitans rhizosphaerae]|uniref:Uncharacterized protein n=1 Tax=Herbihabitans rhizosphaerae TaxID=1872711 RepID=A0A4Q7KIF0_9PSEU|nr:hypothetical protein [Herbihabitans rhizosphaerae]RZS32678.1 hypothetical protein EV193_11155 [Herbihabitans rhizosphaerae]